MEDTLDNQTPSRFLIGIDLGTTNSALAYVDTTDRKWIVRDFSIPQIVAPATVEARQTLPSFHYEAAGRELSPGAFRLPWNVDDPNYAVGVFARDHGAAVPGRLVVSAKSWLSHSGVDRTAGLLPWHGADDVQKLSPVEVSSRYLAHLRGAWDHQFPEHRMSRQEVVLAVPASFDEVARELTIEAARLAGMVHVVLVEEPQAAFYAWIDAQGEHWEQRVKPGQKILVCDVGGGTSDFTLIRVRPAAGGKVLFHRVAVGEHLILGGDNLDLAIAHHVEQKLGRKLEARFWGPLVRSSRVVKETLLAENPPPRAMINVAAGGSKLVGGAIQVEVTLEEIRELLLEGFLPRVRLDDKPIARKSGFQEFGLPYARDAAITRYLAAFLSAHRHAGQVAGDDDGNSARPDMVLFNGGMFESPALRERLLDVLASWFNETGGTWRPEVLRNDRLDLAVSRGAAYYAMVRRGHGVRITGGLAHSYYIGVESKDTSFVGSALADADRRDSVAERSLHNQDAYNSGQSLNPVPSTTESVKADPAKTAPDIARIAKSRAATGVSDEMRGIAEHADSRLAISRFPLIPEYRERGPEPTIRAVCLLPAGVEEGQTVDLAGRTFNLLIRQPVEFPLYASSTRTTDQPGDLLAVDAERMTSLPPIRTVLQSGRKATAESVQVRLHAKLTEIGTLDIWCAEVKGDRTWRLQFDVRAAVRADAKGHVAVGEAEGVLDDAVLQRCQPLIAAAFGRGGRPESLMKTLEQSTGLTRHDWPSTLLRGMWETLLQAESSRKISDIHEARWLNFASFCLRPGYGLAADDWRVSQMWKLFPGGITHPKNELVRAEWWILWRRLAGGMTAGQQRTLAESPLADWRTWFRKKGINVRGRSPAFQFGPHESAEVWRLLGSLELLPPALKQEVGQMVLDRLPRESAANVRDALFFALGRLGARVPMYGPLNSLIPAEIAEQWSAALISSGVKDEKATFTIVQLCRRTDDRYRDISEATRDDALRWLTGRNAAVHAVQLVRIGGQLEAEEQRVVFGESLPRGLRIE